MSVCVRYTPKGHVGPRQKKIKQCCCQGIKEETYQFGELSRRAWGLHLQALSSLTCFLGGSLHDTVMPPKFN